MKTTSRLALLSLPALLLPACGGAAPAKSVHTPAPASADQDEGRVTSEPPRTEKKQAADFDEAEPPQEAALEEESEEADGVSEAGPGDDDAPRNFLDGLKTKGEMARALRAQVDKLGSALDPAELSCDGAAPLRDAICAIAERLCDLDSSNKESKQCSLAKKSCDDAKSRFRDKCG